VHLDAATFARIKPASLRALKCWESVDLGMGFFTDRQKVEQFCEQLELRCRRKSPHARILRVRGESLDRKSSTEDEQGGLINFMLSTLGYKVQVRCRTMNPCRPPLSSVHI